MSDRKTTVGWKTILFVLSFIASHDIAAGQNTSPPPAVSVTPAVMRQITETGNYIGRITAIDKVDIVARVPGFIEERAFTEGQQPNLS